MGKEVDRLEISIETRAKMANAQLDGLISKLESVKTVLGGINAGGLTGIANGVGKLATAMTRMNSVKTTDVTRIVKNIQKLSNIDTSKMHKTASALNTLATAYTRLGAGMASASGQSLSNLKTPNAPTSTVPNLPSINVPAPQLSGFGNELSNKASLARKSIKALTSGISNYSVASNRAIGLTEKLSYLYASLYGTTKLLEKAFHAFSSTIVSSFDYIEEYNYYNVIFDKIAKEWSKDYAKYGYDNADAYAKSFEDRSSATLSKMTGFNMNRDGTLSDTFAPSLGIDITELTNFSASLAQVTNSLGLTGEASLATSKALTMLVGDESSFMNLDLKGVMQNFQSGIIGQSRALYKYGIDITNATLKQYAYRLGIEKNITEMTQAEKMQLRLIAILDQSKVAWGDLANTINSPSNQVRLLKNEMHALSRTIGDMFLPVVAEVLPYINGLVIAIRRLFQWVASLMGIDLGNVIGQSSAGYSDAFADLADDADDASNAIDSTAKSAKKLENQLLGFDEVNKLTDNSDSSSGKGSNGKGGSAIDLTDELNKALGDYESVWNAAFDSMDNKANKVADDIAKFFKNTAKYAEPTVDALKHLWNDGLSKFGKFSYVAAQGFLDNFLNPLGKWTLGKGLPEFIDITDEFFDRVDWDKLARQLNVFWRGLEPFAEAVGEGMIKYFKGMTIIGALTIKAIGAALEFFGKGLTSLPPSVVEAAGEALGVAIGAILTFKTVMGIAGTIDSVRKSIGTFIAVIIGHPYLAIAGGIVAIVAAIAGFASSRGGVDVLKDINNTFNDSVNSGLAEANVMKGLADEYFNLTSKAQMSNEERDRARTIAKKLIDEFPELKQYYDDSSGLLITEKDNIQKVIDKKLEEIKIKAYEEKLIDLERKRIDITDKLTKAQQSQNEAAQSVADITNELANLHDKFSPKALYLNTQLGLATIKYGDATAKAGEYQQQLNVVDGEMEKSKGTYLDLMDGIDKTSQSMQNNGNTAQSSSQQASSAVSGAASSIQSSFYQIRTGADGTVGFVNGAFGTIPGSLASSGNNAKNYFLDNLRGVMGEASNFANAVRNSFAQLDLASEGANAGHSFMRSLQSAISGTQLQFSMNPDLNTSNLALKISAIRPKGFATGGFPESGQYFLAREKGPEFVGRIGNRTAVANNDQITQGIAQAVAPAVYNAVRAAMGTGRQDGGFHGNIYIGNREVVDVVVEGINQQTDMGKNPLRI